MSCRPSRHCHAPSRWPPSTGDHHDIVLNLTTMSFRCPINNIIITITIILYYYIFVPHRGPPWKADSSVSSLSCVSVSSLLVPVLDVVYVGTSRLVDTRADY